MNKYTEAADKAFAELFCGKQDRGDGLAEIPHEGYQLVVSALEAIRWETRGEDRDTIKGAIAICERLRDEQKKREWARLRNCLHIDSLHEGDRIRNHNGCILTAKYGDDGTMWLCNQAGEAWHCREIDPQEWELVK